MGKVEQLDLRRRPSDGEGESGSKPPGFESLEVGESRESTCALCGGVGRIWRDEHGFLQQTFEHEDPCLVDVLMRHVAEEMRLKLGLGLIHRLLLGTPLTDAKMLRDANLLVTGWVTRLLAGDDIAISPYEQAH